MKPTSNPPPTVMVVDDTPENLMLLGDMLGSRGYRVVAFPDGSMALSAARRNPPDLILLDITMPDMDGFAVCRQFKLEPELAEVPVLFISARQETGDKLKAFAAGGVDYITKPFQFEEVQARVATHLHLRRLQLETEAYALRLEDMVSQKVAEISSSQVAMIRALAKLAESRDDDTGEHIERTRTYCRVLAEELMKNPAYQSHMGPKFAQTLFEAAALHDIGKVGISDGILLKAKSLTASEFEIMKTHVAIGAATLSEVNAQYPGSAFLEMGELIARYHHERWDGKGYMEGLSGEAIPLCARIMAVADVYDALRSKRPYKVAYPHEQTVSIILAESGTHFDPGVVEAFRKVASRLDRLFAEFTRSDSEETVHPETGIPTPLL